MPETEIPPALRGDIYCCAEAGKAERAFPSAHAGDTCFMPLRSGTAQPIAGALWGRRRFRITLPEMGAVP